MIDTDKYEGHTEGPWQQYSFSTTIGSPDRNRLYAVRLGDIELVLPKDTHYTDAQLIAHAPLLLEEVKRLYEVMKEIKDCALINARHDDTLNEEWEYILELATNFEKYGKLWLSMECEDCIDEEEEE